MGSLTKRLLVLTWALTAPLVGCGGGTVDPVAANATAGCETATANLLGQDPTMLPGRACLNCHTAGGQASAGDVRWTVAGTVFGDSAAACNGGGLSGVTVEILRSDGSVQATLTTNSVGNFYTLQSISFPMRARVSMGTKMLEMTELQATGNCASCHASPPTGGAPGRIYLK